MTMRKHTVITYRAFYNEENNDKHDTQTQVVVAESCQDFTDHELEHLRRRHGVANILVEEVQETL